MLLLKHRRTFYEARSVAAGGEPLQHLQVVAGDPIRLKPFCFQMTAVKGNCHSPAHLLASIRILTPFPGCTAFCEPVKGDKGSF